MRGLRPRLRLLALALLFVVGATSEVQADGISVEEFGLSELIQQSQSAVLVEVIGARNKKSGAFEAKIKKVWALPEANTLYSAGSTQKMKFLEADEFEPGKWVIVRRYWDARSSGLIKEGAELILFPAFHQAGAPVGTVVESSKQALRKLDMMFQKDWKQKYKQTPTPRLAADLADYDLYESAYELLSKRRALRPTVVLDALSTPIPHDLFAHHLKKIGKKQSAFLEQAAKRSTTEGGHLVEILRRHFYNGPGLTAAEVKALAIYLGGLDFANKKHVDICYYLNYTILRYLETKTGKRDAHKFIPYFSRYIPKRSDGGGSEEHVWKFYKLLSEKHKAKLVTGLMLAMERSAHGEVDDVSLEMFADAAQQLPVKRSIAFLLKVQPLIDPDAFDGCSQVSALVKATTLHAKHKASLASLKKLSTGLLPMYRCNVESDLQAELERLAQSKR